jgi:glycine/D-amino acid oxidase-like deaminating enzyme
MTAPGSGHDAIVIGGGFYGAAIAIHLSQAHGFKHVVLLERQAGLLTRASYHNQARVHNGYHYPRSFTTAYRSRINLPRFVRDWPAAVRQDFTKVYAIARRNSKVTGSQFVRFCKEIGARTEQAPPSIVDLFEPRLIESVFLVDEYAFDSTVLARWAREEMQSLGIEVRLQHEVQQVRHLPSQGLQLDVKEASGHTYSVQAPYVFNCTYSGLRHVFGDTCDSSFQLKHEVTEMALVDMPEVLRNIGITVMDGPFFSTMPFPARPGLHTLSHVRYTPQRQWLDDISTRPYDVLAGYARETRFDRMVRDSARYVPALLGCQYRDSLFEVKTVLLKNEGDDGRPILFEQHAKLPGCYSVLGGKIDNIYDVLDKLDQEHFSLPRSKP